MMYPGGYMTGAMGGWMFIWFLVWAAVIALVVVLILRVDRSTRTADSSSAKRILDERLARGEIDAQEYRDRRALLGG